MAVVYTPALKKNLRCLARAWTKGLWLAYFLADYPRHEAHKSDYTHALILCIEPSLLELELTLTHMTRKQLCALYVVVIGGYIY